MVYRSGILFDRQKAIRLSGMSEKAYTRSFNSLQNGLGVKWVFDFSFACSNFDVDTDFWIGLWIVCGGGAGTNWMLENWQFSLGVLGSFPLYKRVCPCKFQFLFYQCSFIPYQFSM